MSSPPFPTTPVPGWESRFPWLRAGTTRRFGKAADSIGMADARCAASDLETGNFDGASSAPADPGTRSYDDTCGAPADPGVPLLTEMLLGTAGEHWRSVIRSLQVHGALTRVHSDRPAGPNVVGEGDGHVTRLPGVLLTVTIADCVPVFVADPVRRAVGLLHAGWRGMAAGVVESGIAALGEAFRSRPADLAVHLGPAICGECYEVGPEVFQALGQRIPPAPRSIDLRRVIKRRATASGVGPERVTVSRECTLCGDGWYFSHRRGDAGRQRAFIGIVA